MPFLIVFSMRYPTSKSEFTLSTVIGIFFGRSLNFALKEHFALFIVLNNVNVIVPQNYGEDGITPGKRREYKVLYLLHGLKGDRTSWMRSSSIERYAVSAQPRRGKVMDSV